jgi:hypothetical protein
MISFGGSGVLAYNFVLNSSWLTGRPRAQSAHGGTNLLRIKVTVEFFLKDCCGFFWVYGTWTPILVGGVVDSNAATANLQVETAG